MHLEMLPAAIENCLKSSICHLDKIESTFGQKMSQKLRTQKPEATFLSQVEFNQKRLLADYSTKMFLIERKIQNKIFVNKQLLALSEMNFDIYFGLVNTLAEMWVLNESVEVIQSFARKIFIFERERNISLSFKSEGHGDVGLFLLPESRIYFVDSFNSYDLTSEMQKSLCPSAQTDFRMQHWKWSYFRGQDRFVAAKASANVSFLCSGIKKSGQLQIGVVLEIENGSYQDFLSSDTELEYKVVPTGFRFLLEDVH